MKEELLITRREDKILSVRVKEGRPFQIQADSAVSEGVLGDIYVGKVRNIVKNINAAFVEFQKGQMGYLSLSENCVPIHTDGAIWQEGRVLIGDEIIVQVVREAVKTKPPTLSGKLELTGRYVVLSAGGASQASVSRKIQDKEKREQIKAVLSSYCTEEYGFVARTNSAWISEEELRREIEALRKQYEEMVSFGRHKAQFTRLRQAPGGHLCQIRDSYQESTRRILTDDPELFREIQDYIQKNQWKDEEKLELWNPECGKLDAVYNISKSIDHALMPKVWLKSGGYLVIQPTEALVSVDVNTGKAVSKKREMQKTFRKVNQEAAEEIARQLRLRNLSGIILIDFIDMEQEEDNRKLLETLRHAVAADPVQTTVVDMTKLGLVEVTRKKIRKSLFEQLR